MISSPSRFAAAVLSGAALCPAIEAGEAGGGRSHVGQRDEITADLRLAVERGFRHLLEKQSPQGDFDAEYPVAVNALAGLAFLAGGHTEKAGGKYTLPLRRATTALLRRQNAAGYFEDGRSFMYGHGFAALYLAELYGSSTYRQEEVRAALKKAMRVIEGSQSNTGGWDYHPGPEFGEVVRSSESSDTSITVCQTMALRAAKDLGIAVNGTVVERAKKYIEQAQREDGGFKYRQELVFIGSNASAFPRSAAGVCILYSLGDYHTEAIRKGYRYLKVNYEMPWSIDFPFYAHYYCSQAMFQAGGDYWREYFAWIKKKLLENQKSKGSWPANGHENESQCTAMALIILQLPYRFLPIHER